MRVPHFAGLPDVAISRNLLDYLHSSTVRLINSGGLPYRHSAAQAGKNPRSDGIFDDTLQHQQANPIHRTHRFIIPKKFEIF